MIVLFPLANLGKSPSILLFFKMPSAPYASSRAESIIIVSVSLSNSKLNIVVLLSLKSIFPLPTTVIFGKESI